MLQIECIRTKHDQEFEFMLYYKSNKSQIYVYAESYYLAYYDRIASE